MEELRLESRTVAQTVSFALRERRAAWQPSPSLAGALGDTRRQLLKLNETLVWLHHHWDLRPTLSDPVFRPGPQAKLQTLIWRTVRGVLNRYINEEHELIANLVRMADTLAKRVDDLEADHDRLVAGLRAELISLSKLVDERFAQLAAGEAGA